jgi:hypothetical protein
MNTSQAMNTNRQLMPIFAVLLSLIFSASAPAREDIDPMAASVGQWFTMIEQSFISLAEAMPTEKYGFKPADGAFANARTFAEQVKHVACANFAFFSEIEKKEPPDDARRLARV